MEKLKKRKRYSAPPTIREIDGLTILFFDHQTIYIKNNDNTIAFHRWFVKERWFYTRNWKPFRSLLMDNRRLTMGYIYNLAERLDINIQSVADFPDLTGLAVRVCNN